jgi:hypothetical protein
MGQRQVGRRFRDSGTHVVCMGNPKHFLAFFLRLPRQPFRREAEKEMERKFLVWCGAQIPDYLPSAACP